MFSFKCTLWKFHNLCIEYYVSFIKCLLCAKDPPCSHQAREGGEPTDPQHWHWATGCEGSSWMHGSEKGPSLTWLCAWGWGWRGHRRFSWRGGVWAESWKTVHKGLKLWIQKKDQLTCSHSQPPFLLPLSSFRIWAGGSDQGPRRGTSVFLILPGVFWKNSSFNSFLASLAFCVR